MTDWYTIEVQERNARYIEAKWNKLAETLKQAPETDPAVIDYRRFLAALEPVRSLSLEAKAQFVNAAVNDWVTYTHDASEKGHDHWAPAHETVHSRKGDCEDFVFLKYAALRHLGVPSKNLVFAGVADKGGAPGHAVLLFCDNPRGFCFTSTRVNDEFFAQAMVLDNTRSPFPPRFAQTKYTFYIGLCVGQGVLRGELPPAKSANANGPSSKKRPRAPGY
jgi:predicted transglutaminase-like cysteine proteinase